jgi:beta-glucosidase
VVVVNAGSPVEMPWSDEVAAVLLAWFPGQEFGDALGDILFGAAEPGGRLPTTWGVREKDVPVLSTQPVDGALHYSETLHIGYRGWLHSDVPPAYPFGHGLGYTSWEYQGLRAPAAPAPGDGLTAEVRVRNTGPRRGKEVVQVYLDRAASGIERPAVWLAGYAVVEADPGEEVTVRIPVERRAFEHWAVTEHGWRTEPGVFRLSAGRSVADRPLATDVELPADVEEVTAGPDTA